MACLEQEARNRGVYSMFYNFHLEDVRDPSEDMFITMLLFVVFAVNG